MWGLQIVADEVFSVQALPTPDTGKFSCHSIVEKELHKEKDMNFKRDSNSTAHNKSQHESQTKEEMRFNIGEVPKQAENKE